MTISVHGRFMSADHSEHDCIVETMSPHDAVISCGERPRIGERIIAYLDHVGRIEGQVTEAGIRYFVISINATDRKRDKLSAQLTWLANKHTFGLPDDRRHDRVAPSNPMSEIKLHGCSYSCRIVDLSVSGAAVEVDVRPAFGSMVVLGTMRGRVIRHFQEGIAIEFLMRQPEEAISQLSSRGSLDELRIRS
ncbi:PilZ domain-containing protein [Hoeflea sp.]|uniref:PilZ domain-containing protein n=1 Tax=Hoeflea sp. TaxID=1940281 RepID=UPI0025C22BB9|nr:PilZ domain-containing protein [Hoeflea sp.]